MQSSARHTLAAILSFALAPWLVSAQGEKTVKPEPETPSVQAESKAPKPDPQPYLLSISVKESNSGKPILEKD